MNLRAEVGPFPAHRLARVGRAEVELARRLRLRARLEALAPAAFELGRQIGLGGAALAFARVEGLALEDLRRAFPGEWRFAVLNEPTSGRMGFLALEGSFWSLLLSRLEAPGEEPERGRDGLWGWLVCRGLAALGGEATAWRFCGVATSVGQVGRLCQQSERMACAWIRITAGFAPGRAAWLEPEASLQRAPADAREVSAASDIAIPFSLLLGQVELEAAEAGGMRRGDVVFFQPEAGGRRVLACGGARLYGQIEGANFRFSDWSLQSGGGDMGEVKNEEGRALEPVLLEGLPVPVSVEAGTVQLTVGELSGLRCGDVIVLGDLLLAPVSVRAGSRLLGRGELVDVDGRRGVRLLEVFLAGADHADAV